MSFIPAMQKKPSSSDAEKKNLAWYLIYTKPRQEIVALENLERQGFNVYLPLYKKLKKPAKNALNQEITIVRAPICSLSIRTTLAPWAIPQHRPPLSH